MLNSYTSTCIIFTLHLRCITTSHKMCLSIFHGLSVAIFMSYFVICCRASPLFVGIYEPTKRKLLDMFPEILSAVAHLVSPNTLYVGLADCLQQGALFFFFTLSCLH
jgi:hypothetical protein